MFYVVRYGRPLRGVDAVHYLKIILSGVPLKCFHIDAAAPRTSVPGHVTKTEVPQSPSTTDSSSPPHSSDAFGTLSSEVPAASQRPSDASGDHVSSARDPAATTVPHRDVRTPSVRDCSTLPTGFEEFEELFSPELGLVANQTHTVTVRPHVPPVQAKLHRLPSTLRESVMAQIQIKV
ncbi:unnamed protein product [Ixodes hexagonus]